MTSEKKKAESMEKVGAFFRLITLFVSGAAVMMLEVLGTKVISPFFGVSLYVWSSLITVTLLSLALGYWLGGLAADKSPRPACLYGLIFLSGLTVALIPRLAPLVIGWTENLELRVGTLTASFLLFSLPLLGLGMVSPYAVKLHAKRLEKVGSAAGGLYAISTLGSFVGTLLAGFMLIPLLGVREIFLLVSLFLTVTALLGLLVSKAVRSLLVFLLVAVVTYGILLANPHKVEAGEAAILHLSEGHYGQIKVVDYEGIRSLLVNGSSQNFVRKDSTDKLFEYSPYAVYLTGALVLRPQIKRVLMIGLGGGTIPKIFSRYGAAVDVIEIDPRMPRVASEFFGYDPGAGQVYSGDGRYMLRHLHEKGVRYDAVILDAFASYDQPSHLFTREMFREVKGVLNQGGVLGINTAAFIRGADARVSQAILKTLEAVFAEVEAFRIEATTRIGTVIFFASDTLLEWRRGASPLSLEDEEKLVTTLERNRTTPLLAGGMLLTDNFNPLPYWGVPIYRAWREEVIKFFGLKILQIL